MKSQGVGKSRWDEFQTSAFESAIGLEKITIEKLVQTQVLRNSGQLRRDVFAPFIKRASGPSRRRTSVPNLEKFSTVNNFLCTIDSLLFDSKSVYGHIFVDKSIQ